MGNEESVIAKTISKDMVRTEEDALGAIYKQLRSGDAPDLETAKNLIDRLFFNEKRYDLGDVGRYRLTASSGWMSRFRPQRLRNRTSSRSSTT